MRSRRRWIYEGLYTVIDEQKNQHQLLNTLAPKKDTSIGPNTAKAAKDFDAMTDEIEVYETAVLPLTDLLKFAWQTQDLATAINVDKDIMIKIKALTDSADSLNVRWSNAERHYNDELNQIYPPHTSRTQLDSEKNGRLRPVLQSYKDVLIQLGNSYLPYENTLRRLNAHLYALAEDKAAASRATATEYSRVAIFIYVLGSVLAIVGKWYDIKEKQQKQALPTSPAPVSPQGGAGGPS
jgi:hypothetical protein